jgi:predicted esterase
MTKILPVFLLCTLIFACRQEPMTQQTSPVSASTPAAWKAPATEESLPFARARRVTGFRLNAPRYVFRSQLQVSVDAGCDLYSQGWGNPITGRVEVQGNTGLLASGTIAIVRAAFDEDEPTILNGPGFGSITLSVGEIADQTLRVSFTPDAICNSSTMATLVGNSRSIQKVFSAILPEHQPEIATWLEDANRPVPIWGKVPTWRQLEVALQRPTNPYHNLRGFLQRSYWNPQLQRRQPYLVIVPPTLDLTLPVPVLLHLHGSGGDYRNLISDEANGQRFDTNPMLIIGVGAYKYEEYRHIALNDLRWILDDVARKYQIDPKRIFLSGISLGGRGALEAAARLPDIFAGISAHGVWGIALPDIDPVSLELLDPIARSYRLRTDMRTWLPNLTHLTTEICAGTQDENTPPEQGMLYIRMLKFWGVAPENAKLRLFPTGHDITMPHYDWSTSREWMLKTQKVEPHSRDAVRLRLDNLRFGKAGFLSVTQLTDYARIGEAHASIAPMAINDVLGGTNEFPVLRLATRNIQACTIDADKALSTLIIDNQHLNTQEPRVAPIHLRKESAATQAVWRIVDCASVNSKDKRPGRSCPLWDAWSNPIVFVWDDVSSATAAHRLARSARESAQCSANWGEPSLPVCAWSQLSSATMAQATIVLFTSDAGKTLSTQSLPRPFGAQGVDTDLRIALRPSPWSEEQYLMIVELRRGQGYFDLHQLGLGFGESPLQADWLAMDLTWDRKGKLSETFIRAAGSYSHDWLPASETKGDFRNFPMLGSAAGGK